MFNWTLLWQHDDSVRRTDTQNKIDNLRETTKRQHIMEIEQLKETQRAEIRKLQVGVQYIINHRSVQVATASRAAAF